MTFIRHLSRAKAAAKAGLLWTKAVDHASKGQAQEAMNMLDKISEADNIAIEIGMLKAYLLAELGQSEASYDLCRNLVEQISDTDLLGPDEIIYTSTYVRWLAQASHQELKLTEQPDWLTIDTAGLNLDRVPKHWKQNFPVPLFT